MLLLAMTVQYVVQHDAASLNMVYSNHVYVVFLCRVSRGLTS